MDCDAQQEWRGFPAHSWKTFNHTAQRTSETKETTYYSLHCAFSLRRFQIWNCQWRSKVVVPLIRAPLASFPVHTKNTRACFYYFLFPAKSIIWWKSAHAHSHLLLMRNVEQVRALELHPKWPAAHGEHAAFCFFSSSSVALILTILSFWHAFFFFFQA